MSHTVTDNTRSLSIAHSSVPVSDESLAVDSSLTFTSYAQLTDSVHAYATSHNFEVRLKTGNPIASDNHHGCFKCWCSKPPPNTNQLPTIDTTARKRRRTPTLNNNKGQVAVGCHWTIHFMKTRPDPQLSQHYIITSRSMEHTGPVTRLIVCALSPIQCGCT